MYEYTRDVFYYETDQMGVVHHSNFVRWLEEARTAFFAEIGIPYAKMEAQGVLSPIMGINIRFKYFARFGDRFTVHLKVEKYTGVRFQVSYSVVNQKGAVLLEGESAHAFIGSNYRPVSLSKTIPAMHARMKKYMEERE